MKKALIVMKKDLKEIRTSFQIFGTMIAMPALFTAIALITFAFIFAFIPTPDEMMDILFGSVNVMAMYNIMFLMSPIILPTYIAADSFIGEKARKTIEALLVAPISDKELLIGKILVSFVPTVLISYIFVGIYSIGVDILQLINYGTLVFIFPDLGFLIGILSHIPLLCLITIEIMVSISLKVKGIREAQQIGGIIVIPIISFMFLPYIGVNIYDLTTPINVLIFCLITLIYIGVVFVLFYIATKIFQRHKIILKI
ncbi:MAG: ABC transporter permease subunit [Candidatus Helarchaeota archaeon]